MSACRSCGAEIRWARSARLGVRMPLNPEPDRERGNVILDGEEAIVCGPNEAAGRRAAGLDLYLPHFATCPNAQEHRRR